MNKNIHISDMNNSPAVFFNTGLDPRSFARTKMSQNLTEEGFVVLPGGSFEVWKSAGVDEFDGVMKVWGPLFESKRLDLLINENNFTDDLSQPERQEALQAVIYWIKAKMFLGDTHSAPNPAASFIGSGGRVFFGPEILANRCLFSESTDFDRYNCPDLKGMDAAVFCAGAMLYTILTKIYPYPMPTIFQDMRDGIFMPVHVAAPTLNKNLASLIQSALTLPCEDNKSKVSAAEILTDLLKILTDTDKKTVSIASLFQTLNDEESMRIEKDKKRYLFKQNVVVKTKRFCVQNRGLLIGLTAGIVFLFIVLFSTLERIASRPTTAGMLPDSVVYAYYNAFSSLDFDLMEACINGANNVDVNAAVSLTAIIKTRQAYDGNMSGTVPAQVWKNNGGELPAPNVFGVTDLSLIIVSGSENEGEIVFRAEYTLWSMIDEDPYRRIDTLILKPDKKSNWRITNLQRVER